MADESNDVVYFRQTVGLRPFGFDRFRLNTPPTPGKPTRHLPTRLSGDEQTGTCAVGDRPQVPASKAFGAKAA